MLPHVWQAQQGIAPFAARGEFKGITELICTTYIMEWVYFARLLP
jgi:hypothetical protein